MCTLFRSIRARQVDWQTTTVFFLFFFLSIFLVNVHVFTIKFTHTVHILSGLILRCFFFSTVLAQPVPFWYPLYSCTLEMEPFVRTVLVVTTYDVIRILIIFFPAYTDDFFSFIMCQCGLRLSRGL